MIQLPLGILIQRLFCRLLIAATFVYAVCPELCPCLNPGCRCGNVDLLITPSIDSVTGRICSCCQKLSRQFFCNRSDKNETGKKEHHHNACCRDVPLSHSLPCRCACSAAKSLSKASYITSAKTGNSITTSPKYKVNEHVMNRCASTFHKVVLEESLFFSSSRSRLLIRLHLLLCVLLN